MRFHTLTAIIHKEGGWFVSECPETGTVSQGETLEDAVLNLKEATELYIQEINFQPEERALITTFEACIHA